MGISWYMIIRESTLLYAPIPQRGMSDMKSTIYRSTALTKDYIHELPFSRWNTHGSRKFLPCYTTFEVFQNFQGSENELLNNINPSRSFLFFCFDYQPKAKIKEISPTPTVNVIERSMRDLILETHIDRPGENPRAPELRVREDPVPVFPYCLRSRGVQMEYDAPIKKNTWHYFYLRFSRNKGGSGVYLCRTEGA